jgi:class 3 adenylate cyclase
VYTLLETLLEGPQFFVRPYHLAYWIFSVLIGGLQELAPHVPGKIAEFMTVLEHLTRTCILLAMYAIFETLTSAEPASILTFWDDSSHVFISIVMALLGIILGFANLTANRYLTMVQETAKQLRTYSEWLLGRERLSAAIRDASVLSLQRITRAVLFMDIRGFTAWSERKSPEQVVTMLNQYFEAAEEAWNATHVIKVKYTGDEIMAVFATAAEAVAMARQLMRVTGRALRQYELSAGIGVHQGDLVEGIIGSKQVKAYDILGDTVNTAKRICDQAHGDEILLSEAVYQALAPETIVVRDTRALVAKGKRAPLTVFLIQNQDGVPLLPNREQS